MPFTVREQAHTEIKGFEAVGIVEPVEVPDWISAMVVEAKKDGRVRLCVNLGTIDNAIVANVFPLPPFKDQLIKLWKLDYVFS